MRASIIFPLSLVFAVAHIAKAEDLAIPSKAAAPQAVQPPARVQTRSQNSPAGVRPGNVNAGRNQPAHHANQNVRRNSPPSVVRRNQPPAFSKPIQRMSVAMNPQIAGRNYRNRQAPEQLDQRRKANANPETSQSANNNRRTDNRRSYFDALKRCPRESRDRHWWRRHCKTIVFVNTGYYYLDANYWYPAFGYDPAYNYSEYGGPIYTYGNLLPDQVIANVQRALQELGYYVGPVTGSLGPGTREAIGRFQGDYGLIITGAPDEPTVMSLGLL